MAITLNTGSSNPTLLTISNFSAATVSEIATVLTHAIKSEILFM
jgi:hypothetical protein